ncbi:MAG: hypothetical protein F6K17_30530 [Okeania sp. SIO3C4]|nr:hypothetical protein [Okeania sp. SIO3C4]
MAFNFLTYSKQIMLISNLPDLAVKEEFLEQFARSIEDTGIVNVETTLDSFNFSAPPFRWAWNGFHMFRFVSKAKFEFIKPNHVLYLSYKFSFSELLLTCFVISAMSIPAFFTKNYQWAAYIILGAWLLGYAGGIFLANYQFGRWVNKVLAKFEYKMAEESGDLPKFNVAASFHAEKSK